MLARRIRNRRRSADALASAMLALYDGFRLLKAMGPAIDTAEYVGVAEALLSGTSWTGPR